MAEPVSGSSGVSCPGDWSPGQTGKATAAPGARLPCPLAVVTASPRKTITVHHTAVSAVGLPLPIPCPDTSVGPHSHSLTWSQDSALSCPCPARRSPCELAVSTKGAESSAVIRTPVPTSEGREGGSPARTSLCEPETDSTGHPVCAGR